MTAGRQSKLIKRGAAKTRARAFVRCLAFVMLLISVTAVLAGCFFKKDAGDGDGTGSDVLSGAEILFTPKPLIDEGRRTPLSIAQKTAEGEGYYMSYPYVCDDGMLLINVSIRAAFTEFAEEYGGSIGYKVRCNNRGILSLTLFSEDDTGETQAVSAANFDCDTGMRFYISDCFGRGEESYRFSLADSITEKVEAEGYTVLSYLPPIDDSRLFYVDEGGLVLLYRKYELCGAEAGWPEVRFRFNELKRYMGEDSLLKRLPYFD